MTPSVSDAADITIQTISTQFISSSKPMIEAASFPCPLRLTQSSHRLLSHMTAWYWLVKRGALSARFP